MINNTIKLSFYAKASIILLGLFAFLTMLYIAQDIIIPIVFAIIIAILLHPIVKFFVRFRINRVVAIIISLLITFIIIAGFTILIFSQLSHFSKSWPLLVEKFTIVLNESITWISGYFDIDPKNISEWILKTKNEVINSSTAVIGQTLLTIGNWVLILFLIPVYVFMILYYESLLVDFIYKIFSADKQTKVKEVVSQTKVVVQRYLIGIVIEFLFVSVLNTTVLFILGIEYAILLGIIGGLLNLIPYIGGLVAVAIPMMIALATKTSGWYAIYVLVLYYIIQLFDNNYIVPIIVASKVKINALFSVIVVIAGNALWGISGMFLSIPILAILKLIFDRIDLLKPWGFLLGDTMPDLPTMIKIKPILKKIIRKKL